MNIGKGANCIISLLHHFLSDHHFGEASICVHADNCSGQNKNRFMMQYFAWRVLSTLSKRVEISFLLVGHTKFAPDWCFGLLKQRYWRTKVGCLKDIENVVNSSAVVNHTQLVGLEDGTVIVPQYDWAKFFNPYFKRQAFKGIKSMHNLVFSSDHPGKALVRERTDSDVKVIELLSQNSQLWTPSSTVLPPVIVPPGLSRERKEYLYEKIREYCPDYSKDIVCPHPDVVSTLCSSASSSPSGSLSPSPKRPCMR